MLSDPNLMAMYNMEIPMMPPMTSGSAMTNGIGSRGTPLLISKGNISARRLNLKKTTVLRRMLLCMISISPTQ